MSFPTPQIFQAKRLLQLPASRVRFAMAPCDRCGSGARSGRGRGKGHAKRKEGHCQKTCVLSGWCSNPDCRRQEKEQQQAQQRGAQAARANGGRRGGRPEIEDGKAAQRLALQAARPEAGGGVRGPLPGEGGRPEAGGVRAAKMAGPLSAPRCKTSGPRRVEVFGVHYQVKEDVRKQRTAKQPSARRCKPSERPAMATAEQRLGPPYLGRVICRNGRDASSGCRGPARRVER